MSRWTRGTGSDDAVDWAGDEGGERPLPYFADRVGDPMLCSTNRARDDHLAADEPMDEAVAAHDSDAGPATLDAAPHEADSRAADDEDWCQPRALPTRTPRAMWQTPRRDGPTGGSPSISRRHDAYRQACRNLGGSWRCSATNAVPLELRPATPYSLAMLLKLRRLSHQCPDRRAAHAALCCQRQRRVAGVVPGCAEAAVVWTHPRDVGIGTGEPRDITFDELAEQVVWENPAGLMLVDVSRAWCELHRQKQQRRRIEAKRTAREQTPRARLERECKTVALQMFKDGVVAGDWPRTESAAARTAGEVNAAPSPGAMVRHTRHQPLKRLGTHAREEPARVVPDARPLMSSTSVANGIEDAADREPRGRLRMSRRARKARTARDGELSDLMEHMMAESRTVERGEHTAALRRVTECAALPSERRPALRPLPSLAPAADPA